MLLPVVTCSSFTSATSAFGLDKPSNTSGPLVPAESPPRLPARATRSASGPAGRERKGLFDTPRRARGTGSGGVHLGEVGRRRDGRSTKALMVAATESSGPRPRGCTHLWPDMGLGVNAPRGESEL